MQVRVRQDRSSVAGIEQSGYIQGEYVFAYRSPEILAAGETFKSPPVDANPLRRL